MGLVLLATMFALAQGPPLSSAPSAEALYQQGLAAERKNDLPAARAAYEDAVRQNPKLAAAHDRLGFVLGRLGRTADALAAFERAVQLQPDLFDAQYHLGATRWWTSDLDGALTALETAVRLRPAHPEARYYLALTLKGKGRLADAIAQLRGRGARRTGIVARAPAARRRAAAGG